MKTFRIIALVLTCGLSLTACNVTRRLHDGEYLLSQVKIETDRETPRRERIGADQLKKYLRQRPNKRYLDELLSVLGLEQRRGHLPSQLSGGQQQRVAIGRALMTRPSLVLADEPTGNLDSQNSSEVLALLKETARKYEQTVIMITHNPAIAHTADRVFQVSDGVLTDLGGCRA